LEEMLLRVEDAKMTPEEMAKQVRALKPIVKEMLEKLKTSHKEAQKVVTAMGAKVEACHKGNPALPWPSGQIAGENEKYKAMRHKAMLCLMDYTPMQVKVQMCNASVNAVKDTIARKCGVLDKKPPYDADAASTCEVKDKDMSMGDWLKKVRDSWREQYKAYKDAESSCDDLGEMLVTSKKKCKAQEDVRKVKAKECLDSFEALKVAACNWLKQVGKFCEDYHSCFMKTRLAFDTLKGKMDTKVLLWKVQWSKLKRMECLLEATNPDTGQQDKVKMAKCNVVITYKLELEYPTVVEAECKVKLPDHVDQGLLTDCKV